MERLDRGFAPPSQPASPNGPTARAETATPPTPSSVDGTPLPPPATPGQEKLFALLSLVQNLEQHLEAVANPPDAAPTPPAASPEAPPRGPEPDPEPSRSERPTTSANTAPPPPAGETDPAHPGPQHAAPDMPRADAQMTYQTIKSLGNMISSFIHSMAMPLSMAPADEESDEPVESSEESEGEAPSLSLPGLPPPLETPAQDTAPQPGSYPTARFYGGQESGDGHPTDNVVASNMETVLNQVLRKEDNRNKTVAKLILVVLKAHGAYTYEHCVRLVDLGLELAKALGYEDDQLYQEIEYGVTYKDVGEVEYFLTRQSAKYKQGLAAYLSGLNLAQEALLHDIGKIMVPDDILYKPGLLTPSEVHIMQQHPVWGAELLARLPTMQHAIPVTRHHHERWDGRGYPEGLAAEDIPLAARIVAVVDSFDAMTSDRPYRRGLSMEQAREEVARHAGRQFDPVVAAKFANIIGRVWRSDES